MDGFDEANRALLVTIPSSIPKQREQFLNACGIVQKAGKRGAEGRTTAPDGVILSELMPFVKAHVSGDKFDFGTLFSTIQQKVRPVKRVWIGILRRAALGCVLSARLPPLYVSSAPVHDIFASLLQCGSRQCFPLLHSRARSTTSQSGSASGSLWPV